MQRVVRSMRILWRAQWLLASLGLRDVLKAVAMFAFAAIIAAFGLAMLNVGAFFALQQVWGVVGSALAVAGIDLVVACALVVAAVVVAGKAGKSGTETSMLQEVRDMALQDLGSELTEVEGRVTRFASELRTTLHHPFNSVLPGVLTTLLKSLVSALRAETKSD